MYTRPQNVGKRGTLEGKMAAELDPLFVKAITLLNSKHPDSTRQLKALIQDYRDKVTGETRREKPDRRESVADRVSPKITEKPSQPSDRSMSPVFSLSVPSTSTSQATETVTKSPAIAVVETVEELSSSSFGEGIREEQLDSGMVESIEELANSSFGETMIEELSSSSLLEPTAKKAKLESDQHDDSFSSISEEDESPEDLLEEAFHKDDDGPICCVCQSHKTDSADNCLIECHECHNYYHQICHKPPMTNKDIHDPRFLWYCTQCSRRMKKEMQAAQKSSSSTTTTTVTQEPVISKPVANPFQVKTSLQPFRRPSSISGSSEASKPSTSAASSSMLPGNGNNGQSQNSQRGSAFLPQDMRMKSMKRLEQVKKRAKIQQQMRKR